MFMRPTVPTRREQIEAIGNDPSSATPVTPVTPAFQTNKPFSSTQNNQTSQPPAAGGLFGNAGQQTSQASGGGGLFGGALGGQTSQPQQSGGLFGNSTAQNTTTGGGLFGSTAQQPQQQQGGSLFGNTQAKPGGLFGATTTGTNTGGGGLFGSTNNNTQNTNTGSSSLFGGTTAVNSTAGTSSLFGRPNANATQPAQQSVFGLSASQPTYNQPSLLGASQYRAGNRTTSFPGHLSMGQSSAPQQPAPGTTKYNYDRLHPTIRFSECVDQVQADLEKIDKMIQMQEKYCRDIEGFVPKHGDSVESLGRDVEYIREKVEAAEQSLSVDAQGVQDQQRVLAGDQKDFDRCQRVVDMLRYPQQYHYTGLQYGQQYGKSWNTTARTTQSTTDAEKKDMDITNNYFVPMANTLKQTLDTYAANLGEIEAHMRVIEQSAVGQAQQLAARRAGVQGQKGSDDMVRELAETLRGFEQSILGAAGLVGQCREGVNEVVLGQSGIGGGRRY